MNRLLGPKTRAGLKPDELDDLHSALNTLARFESAILERLEWEHGFTREPAFSVVMRAIKSLTEDEVL